MSGGFGRSRTWRDTAEMQPRCSRDAAEMQPRCSRGAGEAWGGLGRSGMAQASVLGAPRATVECAQVCRHIVGGGSMPWQDAVAACRGSMPWQGEQGAVAREAGSACSVCPSAAHETTRPSGTANPSAPRAAAASAAASGTRSCVAQRARSGEASRAATRTEMLRALSVRTSAGSRSPRMRLQTHGAGSLQTHGGAVLEASRGRAGHRRPGRRRRSARARSTRRRRRAP